MEGGSTTTLKYYPFAGGMVAMHDGTSLKYFLTDHLSSVIAVLDASGNLLSEQRYLPFGQVRDDVGTITQTDFSFTGQRALDAQGNQYDLGLMDYRARFYSPYLNRFIQPDTLVPGAGNPQAFNRYTYTANNPLNFNDPSGHIMCDEEGNCRDHGKLIESDKYVDTEKKFLSPFASGWKRIKGGNNFITTVYPGHPGLDVRPSDDSDTTGMIIASAKGTVVVNDYCGEIDCDNMDIHTVAANYGYGNMLIVEYKFEDLPYYMKIQTYSGYKIVRSTDEYGNNVTSYQQENIRIQPNWSVYILYAHFDKGQVLPPAGSTVFADSELGKWGSEGYSTGVHLHFAVKIGPSGALGDGGTYDSALNAWLEPGSLYAVHPANIFP